MKQFQNTDKQTKRSKTTQVQEIVFVILVLAIRQHLLEICIFHPCQEVMLKWSWRNKLPISLCDFFKDSLSESDSLLFIQTNEVISSFNVHWGFISK